MKSRRQIAGLGGEDPIDDDAQIAMEHGDGRGRTERDRLKQKHWESGDLVKYGARRFLATVEETLCVKGGEKEKRGTCGGKKKR